MTKKDEARHKRFVQEYLKDFNGTRAAIEAGYSPKSAKQQASRLLTYANVHALLAEEQKRISLALEADADKVFRRWWDTAHADPSELTQNRIGPCRYCWGDDHGYQWKTLREFEEEHLKWEAETPPEDAAPAAQRLHALREPNDAGGYGYRLTREPNDDCPECSGLGVSYVWMADTRSISPQARLLFEGVQESAQGKKIVMADRSKNLELVARRLGMLKDKVEHDVSDPMADLLREINSQGSAAPLKEDDPDE